MSKQTSIHPGWFAGGLLLLVILWMLTGLFSSDADDSQEAADSAAGKPLTRVRVMDSQAQDLTREARVSARTAAMREVNLRAEVSGRVLDILVERGTWVETGAVIARLDKGDRPARLEQAQAQLKRRELEYRAAQNLHKKKVISDVELATARANMTAALAELQQVRTALENCDIVAPFAGVLESRAMEIGHYANVGDHFGRFIQRQPFLVKAQVPEDVVVYLYQGLSSRALLPDGREVDGQLRYVANKADENTRTFPVELEVRGLKEPVIAGASAVLMLPLELVRAHVVNASALALNDAGEFGVKAVNEQGVVEFHAGKIVQAQQGEIWLTGLPEKLRIISVGQGFVSSGDQVEAVTSAEPQT